MTMVDVAERDDRTLEVAEEVAEVAASLKIDTALIGAGAMAVHNYSRATSDLDLASSTHPGSRLTKLESALRERGYETELRMPDDEDPLGGVLVVRGDGHRPVEVVNYYNPARPAGGPGDDAIETAERLIPGSNLRVARLPELIALKLYAGGRRSESDVIELLECNAEYSREEIVTACARHGLDSALRQLLEEVAPDKT